MTTIIIPPALAQAINATWRAIAPDAAEFCESNIEAGEIVLDANRLSTFGYPEAEAMVKVLIKEHGLVKVYNHLAKHFNFI